MKGRVSLKEHCEELFRFHSWRRKEISALLEDVDEVFFEKQINGSFGSLFIILRHLVWAEKVWLGRVKEQEVASMTENEQDVKGMLKAWENVSNRWTSLVSDMEDEDFYREISYFNSKGERFTNNLHEVIIHLIDHSTYHIGQMMNAVRGFELEPVSTNYIHYLRSLK